MPSSELTRTFSLRVRGTTAQRAVAENPMPTAKDELLRMHLIFNFSVNAACVLLLAVLNQRVGCDTPDRLSKVERQQLAAWLRTIFRMTGAVNYGYHFSKAAAPGVLSTARKGVQHVIERSQKSLDSLQPKAETLEAEYTNACADEAELQRQIADKCDDKPRLQRQLARARDGRAKLQRRMVDLRVKMAALEEQLVDARAAETALGRFERGWHPLASHWRKIRAGFDQRVRSIKDLNEYPALGDGNRLTNAWFSAVLDSAVQRLKSYLELNRIWSTELHEWQRAHPEHSMLFRMFTSSRVPRNAEEWLTFYRVNGTAILPGSAEALEIPETLNDRHGFRDLLKRNEVLSDYHPVASELADLLARKPTYTECDPFKHPMYPVLGAPQSTGMYRILGLTSHRGRGLVPRRRAEVAITLLNGKKMTVVAGADSRLASFTFDTPGKTGALSGKFRDPVFGTVFPESRIGGARLRIENFRHDNAGKLQGNNIYLDLTVRLGGATVTNPDFDGSSRIMVVGFGHPYDLTTDELLILKVGDPCGWGERRSFEVRNVPGHQVPLGKTAFASPLAAIEAHSKVVDAARSETRKLVRGERHSSRLQKHITDSSRDLMRKTALGIVKNAREREVVAIVIPNLKGLRPSRRNSTGANALLRMRQHGALVDQIKLCCERALMPVLEMSPLGLGRVHSACGFEGLRVLRTENETEFNRGGEFVCPQCRTVESAVSNDANLIARKFASDVLKTPDPVERYRVYLSENDQKARRARTAELEVVVRAMLEA